MNNTTNYNLKKPETTDNVKIQDINDNMDAIDTQLKANANNIATKANSADLTILQNDVASHSADYMLQVDDIKGTIATPTITSGKVTKIDHISSTDSTTVIRSDVFTYATNLVTEVRTIIASGVTLTLKYHLDTLRTEAI